MCSWEHIKGNKLINGHNSDPPVCQRNIFSKGFTQWLFLCSLPAQLLWCLHFNCPALYSWKVCVGWLPVLAKTHLVSALSNSVYRTIAQLDPEVLETWYTAVMFLWDQEVWSFEKQINLKYSFWSFTQWHQKPGQKYSFNNMNHGGDLTLEILLWVRGDRV